MNLNLSAKPGNQQVEDAVSVSQTATRFRPGRILVTTDLSSASRVAIPYAAELAGRLGWEITLLHVVEPFHADIHMDTSKLQQERRQKAREQLNALVQRELVGCPKVKAKLRAGHAVTTITRFAQSSATDLIVLASHGRTGICRALIGSVAERVVRDAPCPVLVVRAKR